MEISIFLATCNAIDDDRASERTSESDDYYFRMFIVIHKYPFSVTFCAFSSCIFLVCTYPLSLLQNWKILYGFVYHHSRLTLWDSQLLYRIYAILNCSWVWWWRLCKSLKYFHYWHLPRKVKERNVFFVINFDCCCALKFFFIEQKNLFIHIDIRQISRTNYLQLKAGKFFFTMLSAELKGNTRKIRMKLIWNWNSGRDLSLKQGMEFF